MTPEQKAKKICDKIEGILTSSLPTNREPYMNETIQCAIFTVDEILNCYNWPSYELSFWQQVKLEIEKL